MACDTAIVCVYLCLTGRDLAISKFETICRYEKFDYDIHTTVAFSPLSPSLSLFHNHLATNIRQHANVRTSEQFNSVTAHTAHADRGRRPHFSRFLLDNITTTLHIPQQLFSFQKESNRFGNPPSTLDQSSSPSSSPLWLPHESSPRTSWDWFATNSLW